MEEGNDGISFAEIGEVRKRGDVDVTKVLRTEEDRWCLRVNVLDNLKPVLPTRVHRPAIRRK